MTYSAKDLERWTSFLEDKSHGQEVPASVGAQLIADVRRDYARELLVLAYKAYGAGAPDWVALHNVLKDGAK